MSSPPSKVEFRIDGSSRARSTIVLAHGAGADMDSEFMAYFAAALAKRKHRVVRFEFPYMAARRATGKRKPPDREAVLRTSWLAVIDQLSSRRQLVIGGKSMGGRIASLVADQSPVAGLVCLGYPFHPVGKPERLRVEHLESLTTPTLILQGERDTFGNRSEVDGYALSPALRFCWLADGDHSFKPRKASGRTQQENWDAAVEAIDGFVRKRQEA